MKPVVNDPQGLAVKDALHSLGYPEVVRTRVGKYLVLELDAEDEGAAGLRVEDMCRQLLCNGVIEDFSFTLAPGSA